MRSGAKLRMFITVLVFLNISIFARSMRDPGSGGGRSDEVGENSALARTGNGTVNMFTGQPVYQIGFFNINSRSGFNVGVDLHYSGNIQQQQWKRNDLADAGWLGLGWYLGYSHIIVAHNNKVDMSEHKWYFRYSSGVISEIVKTENGFKIKNDPFWKVIPHYNQPTSELKKIIDGWTIIKTDGSIFRYGDFKSSGRFNASRQINCYGDKVICITEEEYPLRRNFFYRWDLKEAEDINGSKIEFRYKQYYGGCGNLGYTRESYVDSIILDNGDKILFDLEDKDDNEILDEAAFDEFVIIDTKFLRSVRYVDKDDRLIDRVDLTYTGDPGQAPHINNDGRISSKKGYVKRLLTSIKSANLPREVNRSFQYNRRLFPGYLEGVNFHLSGKTIIYNYAVITIPDDEDNTKHYGINVVESVYRLSGVKESQNLNTFYTYASDQENTSYDSKSRSGYFGKVTAHSYANAYLDGYIINTYVLEKKEHKFGVPLLMKMYNDDNDIVAERSMEYDVNEFKSSEGETVIYYINVTKDVSDNSGVKSIQNFGIFNPENGMPTVHYKKNSDGAFLLTEAKYAYSHFPAMENKCMLSQASGTKIYKSSNLNPDNLNLNSNDVIGATFTYWSVETGVWRPKKTYVWNTRFVDGKPKEIFKDFIIDEPLANNWQETGTFVKYDTYGHILETKDAAGVSRATFYREDYALKIGSVSNASYDECGIYTCDYHGVSWERANSTQLSEERPHFGEKNLKVNGSWGPTKNIFGVSDQKDYIFTAWVCPTNSKPIILRAGKYINGTFQSAIEEEFTYSGDQLNKWHLISKKIVKNNLTGLKTNDKTNWLRITVSSKPDNDAIFYVDDVRFYPTDALATTTYYNMLWRKPIVSVDPNANPGPMIEYDQYGRPGKLYKIDKYKSRLDDKSKELVEKREYGFIGDHLRVLFPNGKEILRHGQSYLIRWDEGKDVIDGGVNIVLDDALSQKTIASGITGNTYVWEVPNDVESGACKIIVSSGSKGDESDLYFSIKGNRRPSYPQITKPYKNEEVVANEDIMNDGNYKLKIEWEAAEDPDKDPIYYEVLIKKHRTGDENDKWHTVASNHRGTSITVPVKSFGIYSCMIKASDGGPGYALSEDIKFYIIPEKFMFVRNVSGKIVYEIETGVKYAMMETMDEETASKLQHTYSQYGHIIYPHEFAAEIGGSGVAINGHVAGDGWLGWVHEGEVVGKDVDIRLEAYKVAWKGASEPLKKFVDGLRYQAHVKNKGWLGWVKFGEVAGTTGQHRRIEAIQLKVINYPECHVWYQSYVEDAADWQGWVHDGETSGTTGKSLCLLGFRLYFLIY